MISILGNLTDLDSFSFSFETGSLNSCSTIINGQMMIFGGGDYTYWTQISLIKDCQMTRIGSLPDSFYFGACNTFQNSDGINATLLCFADSGKSNCQRFYKMFKIFIFQIEF